jgi:uncharacterized coiled-coil protein SlyX
MVSTELEGRVVSLEKTTAVHTVKIESLDCLVNKISASLEKLVEEVSGMRQDFAASKGRTDERDVWLKNMAFIIAGAILVKACDAIF